MLQRGEAKEMRAKVPTGIVAFGIASDKVLRMAQAELAREIVVPEVRNLVVQLFGAGGLQVARALSQAPVVEISEPAEPEAVSLGSLPLSDSVETGSQNAGTPTAAHAVEVMHKQDES